MAKRTRFSEYHDRYVNYRLELSAEGILFMLIPQFHSVIRDTVAGYQSGDAS